MDGNPTVLIQVEAQRWLAFSRPIKIFSTTQIADVRPMLNELSGLTAHGFHAAGFIRYEAAPAMDAALMVHPPNDDLPLLWFGVFQNPTELTEPPPATAPAPSLDFKPAITTLDYFQASSGVKALIRQGDTYQVNFTFPLVAPFQGDAYALFRRLIAAQPSDCAAYVHIPGHTLCSASPELFFALDSTGRIVSRPMKGTAARGLTSEQDLENIASLSRSEKARAENIMIVDMIRNDLGRIAEAGSVRVTRMFDVERYPTVLQMTSSVEATTHSSVADILHALFPCASITGAPKVRTMQIIRTLEKAPRGIYTGSIGYFGPGPTARFNVAIRTVHVNHQRAEAVYGIGSGIVWDSIPEDEYDECLSKAQVLSEQPLPDWALLETMLYSPDSGIFLLDRHMARLKASADFFSIPVNIPRILGQIHNATQRIPAMPHKIRLLVDRGGTPTIELSLPPPARCMRLRRAAKPVHSGNVFLYHKTTHRTVYDEHRKDLAVDEDVLLFNEQGHITESTIANIVIERDGRKLTPPGSCGLLAGTFRAELLSQGVISEMPLLWADILQADKIWLINSVRQWIPATLIT
jgi:para-aminobenzoate synthetase/4-amino-4-deoxychorismate lyase